MRARMVTENSGVSETKQGRSYVPAFFAALGLLLVLFGIAFALDRKFKPGVWVEAPAQAVTQPSQGDAVTANTAATASSPGSAQPLQFAKTPLEREVETAYWRFIAIYEDAVMNFDTTRLSDVLDGEALGWVIDEVNEIKAEGYPVKVIEDDRVLRFKQVGPAAATVEDQYISRSVRLDPQTGQAFPRNEPALRVLQIYEFRKIGQTWKVVTGTRDVLGEVGA